MTAAIAKLFSKTKLPEAFSLTLDGELGASASLYIGEAVRWIPQKRLVARGRWQGRDVFVKLFFGHRRSHTSWQHEVSSLRFMADHKIPAPQIVFSGIADGKMVYFIVMESLEPAVVLADRWADCVSQKEQVGLLEKTIEVLAQHHHAGLMQKDLHWNNFLIKDSIVYTLDAGDITLSAKPLSQSDCEENLSQFFSLLAPIEDVLIRPAIQYYSQLCSSSMHVSVSKIMSHTKRKRRAKHKKYIGNKIFRQCSEFFCQSTFRKFVVCNRKYLSDINVFLMNPDQSIDAPGSVRLKSGNTCTVWSVQTSSRQYVVKRYNIKGLWHGLGRLFRATNAAWSWKGSHLLQCNNILTPKPVALVEERFGILRWRAYVVTEYVEGENFWTFFFDQSRSVEEKRRVALQVKTLFDLLLQTGICHGDMKGQNLMVTDEGVALIDLDDLRQYSWPVRISHCHGRDQSRFMRNWQNHPDLYKLFSEILLKGRTK